MLLLVMCRTLCMPPFPLWFWSRYPCFSLKFLDIFIVPLKSQKSAQYHLHIVIIVWLSPLGMRLNHPISQKNLMPRLYKDWTEWVIVGIFVSIQLIHVLWGYAPLLGLYSWWWSLFHEMQTPVLVFYQNFSFTLDVIDEDYIVFATDLYLVSVADCAYRIPNGYLDGQIRSWFHLWHVWEACARVISI